ncbi:unnamed protein product [Ranitomeya imitator]|uniref:Reverse transcriptase domain-containing protein n=1 Tax=Ranitomeya imitator TaxID=111125 RepID=A0ABN9KVS6_9NEOB|nr:unnamed protein product [Ranitomeya imitator]
MGVNIWREDENIIQIDYDRGGEHIPEDVVHKVLENGWGITEPEGHHQIFIVPIPGVKSRLPFIPLTDANQVIQEKQYLWIENPVTATFYMLPKIHKDNIKPPGRPIVSSVGSMCERAGEYLDFFLQPIASSLPLFIRDSSHFIEACGQIELPGDFLLVTCDVESLYSNIGHKEGIEAVAHLLNKKSSLDRGHDSFLLDLLTFVLHHIFFLFDRTYYLQRSGVAMGAKCAPAYANIFLGWWEEKFVYPLPSFVAHVHASLRFIDDIFILWKGTREECEEFINNLNSNPFNIFLTYSLSASETTFLDLKIFPHESRLATNLF